MGKHPYYCPVCHKKYTSKPAVYSHIETAHKELIPDGMCGGEFAYRMEHGRGGRCIICKKETLWNFKTNKFSRFCTNPACKEKYKKDFNKKMISKYGKTSLTDDPEQQRKMLANRKISGVYHWSDGSGDIPYTGSYELDFLRYLDLVLDFDPKDIMAPSPHTYTYKYEGKDHFYFPDFYITSLNLEVEIKSYGNMHQKIVAVDHVKEKLKDDVLRSQKQFNYIKIYDKDYTEFNQLIFTLKDRDNVDSDVIIIAKTPILTEEAKRLLAIEATVYGDGEPFQYQSEVTF